MNAWSFVGGIVMAVYGLALYLMGYHRGRDVELGRCIEKDLLRRGDEQARWMVETRPSAVSRQEPDHEA